MTFSTRDYLLDALPIGWTHRRLKYVADVIPSNVDKLSREGCPPVLLCNYVDTYRHERITSAIEFMKATATPAQIERLSLRRGDITITKDSESPWDIAVPALIADDIPGLVCGYHQAKIAPLPNRMDGGYLAWALRCKEINTQFALAADGITRYGLGNSALADGVVPCPPLEVQASIATYLDTEAARIDALVLEKQHLLETLKQFRRSVIQERSSGADVAGVAVETKDPFLPRVPVTWRFVRLGLVARIGNGSTPSRQNDEYWTDGVFPWLNSAEANQDEVLAGSEFVSEAALRECHLPRLSPGTVLMAMIGQGATRGKCTVLRIEATLSQNIAYIRPRIEVLDGDYLFWYLTSAYPHIRALSDGRGGNQSALSCADIARLRIPLPPITVQQAIASELRDRCMRISKLIEHVGQEILALHELRAVTISDSVLGRTRVRSYDSDDSSSRPSV